MYRIRYVILWCGIYFSTGKLSEKISTWFSPSSGNGASTKDDRRNSEGGKSGSSFASKIRRSFRRRSRTISAGVSFIKTKLPKYQHAFLTKTLRQIFPTSWHGAVFPGSIPSAEATPASSYDKVNTGGLWRLTSPHTLLVWLSCPSGLWIRIRINFPF